MKRVRDRPVGHCDFLAAESETGVLDETPILRIMILLQTYICEDRYRICLQTSKGVPLPTQELLNLDLPLL